MSSQENVNPGPDVQPPPAQAVEKDRVAGKPKLNVVVREATEADLEDIVSRSSTTRMHRTTPQSGGGPDTIPHVD
jgi:hypothetical protein